MGARRAATKENYEKSLIKSFKKAGVGRDLVSIQERSQYVFDTASQGAKPDRRAMIEALRLELDVVKTIGDVHGVFAEAQAPVQAAPPANVTIHMSNMIAMPRSGPSLSMELEAPLEVEVVEDATRDDIRLLEDEVDYAEAT